MRNSSASIIQTVGSADLANLRSATADVPVYIRIYLLLSIIIYRSIIILTITTKVIFYDLTRCYVWDVGAPTVVVIIRSDNLHGMGLYIQVVRIR